MLAALAGWVSVVAAVAGGNGEPTTALLLAMAAVYLAARGLSLADGRTVPLLSVVVAAAVALADPADVGDHLYGPMGYANATAAFFVLSAAAGGVLALRARSRGGALLAALFALGFAAVPFLNGSLTGVVAAVLLLLGAAGVRGRRAARRVLGIGGSLVALALLTTLALTAIDGLAEGGVVGSAVEATITERRVTLWRESLEMMTARPATGVGPQRFAQVSPTALADRDAAWAHHEYLEVGAETGVLGLVLAVLLVAWAFVRLWTGALDAGAAVAGMGVTAVAIHAAVDYVLHAPAVALLAAALVGAGSAAGPVRVAWSREPGSRG